MRTEAGQDPRRLDLIADEAVAYLRDAGNHPLLQSFPQGAVFAFDHDLRYLSAGGTGLTSVGWSREMLEGHTLFEVFPAETAAAIEPHYRAALEGVPSTRDVPYDGRIYSQRLSPIRDATGRVVAGLGFTQDVTETRAAELALRDSEERNRLTFDNAPIGQAIVELDGSWRQMNAAVTTLTGYTEDQLRTMTFQDITHPDDLDLDLGKLNDLVAGEIASYQIEKRYLTAAGQTVWVLLSVSLVRDAADQPLYFISQIQDINDRKRQERALQDLTAMLSHDLRTPAAVIRGFAELLENSPSLEEQEVREHAARIAAAARSMTDLLENALTATTLDTGELVATPAEVRVRDAVARTLGNFDRSTLVVDTSGIEDLSVRVDPVHLDQVITNLLTNVVKYGGGEARMTATRSAPDRVRVAVVDTGPGVEPEFAEHLFDRFTRSHQVRRGDQRGSGLGLYIVQDLTTANGGSVAYRKHPDGGSEFSLDLPAFGPLAES